MRRNPTAGNNVSKIAISYLHKVGFSIASLSGKVSSGVGWIFAGVYVFKEIFLPGSGIM